MSSEEDIPTLYAKDLFSMEDVKNSRLLADENRRLGEENHRLAEQNRALINSLTEMNRKMEKMQAHFSSMSSLKQQNETREEDIRDLRRILMEVVEQNKRLKGAVHISETARQEIKAEFNVLRKLLSPKEPRAQTHTHTQTQLMPETETEYGYSCTETPQNSFQLEQRKLSPSTQVSMNASIQIMQGNMFPVTLNECGKTANQKSLMGSRTNEFRSKIPVYLKNSAQFSDTKSKLTNERSNASPEKLHKNSQKPGENFNRFRNRDVSCPTVGTSLPQTVLNKEKGKGELNTIQKNVITEHGKLHRKVARSYRPRETKQNKGDSIQKGVNDPSRKQAPRNTTNDVCPDASDLRVQIDLNQEHRHEKEKCLLYNTEEQSSQGKPYYEEGTNQDCETALFSLPPKFRNKLLNREKYYSDKEVNYIFQKLLNQEKASYQNSAKMDSTTGKIQKPENTFESETSINEPKCSTEQRMCDLTPQSKQENVEKIGVDKQYPKNSLELQSESVKDATVREQEPIKYNVANDYHADVVLEDIVASEIARKSEKAIQNADTRNSQPSLTRMDNSNQVLPEKFQNELVRVTEQQPIIQDTFHEVPNKTPEISERNKDIVRQIGQSSRGIKKHSPMKESDQVRELKYSNMEMESKSVDDGLDYEKDGEHLDNFEAVVPQVDKADRPLQSDSSSSGQGVIGDPVAASTPKHQRFLMAPAATSTPKDFAENTLNQVFTIAHIEERVVPNQSLSSSDAMDSDSGIEFDQKLSAALMILGTRIIGEIAFQLDKRIMETVFQTGASPSDDDAIKNRFYGYSSQNIGALIMKETLRADGTRDLRKESCFRKRHEKLLNRLREHGYNKMIHEEFVRKMIEKYGTINAIPSQKVIKMYGLEEPEILEALLGETTANKAELVDTLVLLDCLRAMVSWDGYGGGSLFKWSS